MTLKPSRDSFNVRDDIIVPSIKTAIFLLKILWRLDQLGSLRWKSTAHLKQSIPTRQFCKSVFIVILIFTNDGK